MVTTNKTYKPGVKIAPTRNTAVNSVVFSTADYSAIGNLLTLKTSRFNYQVNPKQSGKPGKIDKNTREYRLQIINKITDTRQSLLSNLENIIKSINYKNFIPTNIVFNKISPNSGSFPSFSFMLNNQKFDLVVTSNAKGTQGLEFEQQLESDLNMYFSGQNEDNMLHPDTVKSVVNFLKLPVNDSYKATKTKGFLKRNITFNTSMGLVFNNNTGKTIADIVISKDSVDLYYLSLKLGTQFFVVNAKIGNFFKDDTSKKQINEYFGFDGMQMGNFGKEYEVQTKIPDYSQVKLNLESVLEKGYGNNLIIVHKKNSNNNYVAEIGNSSIVTILKLDSSCYFYPGSARKYANIKVDAIINGKRYKVNFQFRGTKTGDNTPNYLRILLQS